MVLNYKINGYYCSSCMDKVIDSIRDLPGVNGANLNFSLDKIKIELNNQKVNNLDELDQKVKNLVDRFEPSATVEKIERDRKISEESKSSSQVKWYKDRKIYRIFAGVLFGLAGFLLSRNNLTTFNINIGFYLIGYWLAGASVARQAARNLISGKVFDENFLMTIATIGAMIIGEWPEAIAVMVFYKVGDYLQNRAVSSSKNSIRELLEIKTDQVKVKTGSGDILKKTAEEIVPGDLMIIGAGDKIPVDGKVVKGQSALNTSALTGESELRNVKAGDAVQAGMVNSSGSLEVKAEKLYEDSAIARIIKLVEEATGRKSKTEKFITKFARYYTPAVVFLAAMVAVIPPLLNLGSFSTWIYRSLIFLVISCPCALVISIPLSFFAGIGVSARQGILIQGSNFLEALADIKSVIYDKTGTLTEGEFKLVDIKTYNGFSEDKVLKMAVSAEQYSNHALAEAIQKEKVRFDDLDEVSQTNELPGRGLEAEINGQLIWIGSRDWLAGEKELDFEASNNSGAEVLLAVDQVPAGVFYFKDQLKSGIVEVVKNLKSRGIEQTILSGDRQQEVASVAEKLGIGFYSELLPEDKLSILEEIKAGQSPKEKLAYLGDGINDAPSLARSDIGIAMGALGTDVAIDSADVVIMDDKLDKLVAALDIAGRTRTLVWQNIVMALGVKVIFMILGSLGFVGLWAAVFADVGVALMAVFNSLRILWDYRSAN
ncbi:MAG: heavy metal translocating P-type ATPase [Halarsenatibacteraceae bacterium]